MMMKLGMNPLQVGKPRFRLEVGVTLNGCVFLVVVLVWGLMMVIHTVTKSQFIA